MEVLEVSASKMVRSPRNVGSRVVLCWSQKMAKKTCVPEAKGNEKGYICTNDIYHSCSQLKRRFLCHSCHWRRPPGSHIALVSIRYLPWSLGDQIFKSQATTTNKTNIKKEVNGNPALYIDKIITGFQLRLARTCMISNNITNSAKTGPKKNTVRALVQKHSVRVSSTCVATAALEFGNSPATEGNVGTGKTTTYWWYMIFVRI